MGKNKVGKARRAGLPVKVGPMPAPVPRQAAFDEVGRLLGNDPGKNIKGITKKTAKAGKADSPVKAPVPVKAAARDSRLVALDAVGRVLRGGQEKNLKGIAIATADLDSPGTGAIRLNLLVDGRALSVAIFGLAYTGPVFLESGAFRMIYIMTDVAWSGNELGAVSERLRLLLALIGRSLEALNSKTKA